MRFFHICNSSVRLIIVCVTLSTLFFTNTKATVISDPITNPTNGHVYYLLETASWFDSETEALSIGGHLVTVNDIAENDWIFDTFVPLLPEDVIGTLWIGLNDAVQEGSFVWASGEAVAFTNWSNGQPDNARGAEDFAHIWTEFNLPQTPLDWGRWNDAANDGFGVGVPFGIVEVHEPSSLILLGLGVLAIWFLLGYKLPFANSSCLTGREMGQCGQARSFVPNGSDSRVGKVG